MRSGWQTTGMPVAGDVVLGGRGCAKATHTHLAYIVSTAAQKGETGGLHSAGCIELPGSWFTKARLVTCPTGAALLRRCCVAPPLGSCLV